MQVQILGPVRAIAAQGSSRYDEATDSIAIGQEAIADEDLSTQAMNRGSSARILADCRHHREAKAHARSAAELAAQSDLHSEHADTMLDLLYVLAAAGRIPEAHAAATGSLTSTGARATCQEPGNHSDIWLSTHPPERTSHATPS